MRLISEVIEEGGGAGMMEDTRPAGFEPAA